MEDKTVLIEQHPGYRVVTLNRPRRLNAFSEAMHRDLKRAIDAAESDGGTRALLLTGAGRAFCAGQDLSERVSADGQSMVLGSSLETWYNPLVRRLRALPFPVVAAVNGVAAGGGTTEARSMVGQSSGNGGRSGGGVVMHATDAASNNKVRSEETLMSL